VAAKPVPPAQLVQPCIDPEVVPDPSKATDNDFALMMLGLGKAFVDCKQRQADLAKWVTAK